ncbi:MAG TPA: tetratricopeptide repeat protein, partial [Dissulfurispiraceae bacterium]|nr:tetratricopeptide repeat protein [Dissulfurispiraceae bacterium]
NPHLHPVNAAFFRWAFSDFYASNWHPLTWVSHALDYASWGLNPLGHHMTNNILHSVNTFIVVILVTKLLEAWHLSRQQKTRLHPSQERSYIVIAAVTGLLFGLHPLHVESVAWVSERKDLLCAMFFLLSTLAYTKYVSSGDGLRNKYYILVLFLFALALLSKPMAVSFPIVLLILDWHPFNRISSIKSFLSALLEKLPLIALSIVSSVLTVLAQKAGGAIRTFEVIPLSSRLLVSAESLLSYLWKMILPLNLVPYYPYPNDISLFSAEYLLPVIIVTGITVACIVMVKKQRLWLAVWGYYVITLLPVIGIVQVGHQAMADRYTYLPSIGPFILIGLIAAWLWKKFPPGRGAGALFIIVAILIAGSLSFLTYKQIAMWKDSLNLWSYAARGVPEDPRIRGNLGIVYSRLNMPEKAMEQYLVAIKLKPNYAEAHNNLGLIYQSLNMPDKAIEQYLIAVKLKPDLGEPHYNLGRIYQSLHMPDKALNEYQEFVNLNPNIAEAHFNLGLIYYQTGQMENARRELITGLKIKPDDQKAQRLLREVPR